MPGNWLYLLYAPEVVTHWCSGLVCLTRVSIQTMEVVLWFTVFYIHIKVTCPVNNNTNGSSLSTHKNIIHYSSLYYHMRSNRNESTKDKSCVTMTWGNGNLLHCLNITSIYSVWSKSFMQQTYHLGYCFKTEARQFNYISQFEYGTQRSVLWIVKAFTNVISINTLNQVTPEKHN